VVAILFVVTAAGLADEGEIERYAQTLDARLAELVEAASP
jgi:hypothetical protein